MRTRTLLVSTILSTFFLFSHSLFAAIQLTPVVSGLSSPVFVGNAGDGSNRLFIVEQAGVIKVLQPGSSTPTVFLDIRAKVVMNGEEGLLGLAFHPDYANNRRFFVYYSRLGDGTEVIAEYHVSVSNRDIADPTELVLLTIPHPSNTNHNGGMLAFSPIDHFLYIGVGDGGSSNDPPNNAQNIHVLLGKILRIDVDHPGPTGGPYSSPAGNPFFGAVDGSDEIFAFGMRNPWRFSFDRLTGQQWVGDVGQGAHEEVDTPIAAGGNYGWRVYEGFTCTNNDPLLCNPNNYTFPVFDYPHSGGRCSITGGYVYRGSQNALPAGIYIYGDYCTGEILTWNGSTQTLTLDTALNISSFGEDEQGELYVVGLGGTINRIDPVVACSFSIDPSSASYAAGGGTGSVSVTAGSGCGWTAVSNASWIHVTAGGNGNGSGPVSYSVDANAGSARNGTMTIAGNTFTVSQSGAVACTFAISPTRMSFPVNGGSGSVTVTADQGCPWTAVSNVSWITITGGASGSGSGTVSYTVAVYTGKPKNRNGTATIAGATFSVKQSK
jgi:Glucose / Sorbosone dehydrogenase/Viral BACON domain/Putative binding domain, N-terminal